MFCNICGQIPEDPVVSKKSGHLYERRLITKYIEEHGTDPITGESLSLDDLLPIKTQGVTTNGGSTQGGIKAPRSVNATSIPGMLQMFQNEWDALMLETFSLKQHLDTVRQELSHALYQHDAACRVIARLIKERDDARTALTNAKANMEIDQNEGITQDVIKKITSTSEKLSAKRKKRKVSPTLVNPDMIKSYKLSSSHPLHKSSTPGITSVDINPTNQNLILTGGVDGDAILFNRESGKILSTMSAHQKPINQVLFHPTLDVLFTGSADRTARVWALNEKGEYKTGHVLKTHNDEVTGISLQATGDYLATSSLDKTWAFYDISTGSCLVQSDPLDAALTCISFHPDGLILGTGTSDNVVKIWDVKSQQVAASVTGHNGKITGLSFSENGYYLASSSEDATVKIWDLRKLANVHTIQLAAPARNLRFDYSGVYLGVAAGNSVSVYQAKVWTEICNFADHRDAVTDVAFGNDAKFIVSTSLDRHLRIFSA
jgi:pre-mRNA-processing factor 19